MRTLRLTDQRKMLPGHAKSKRSRANNAMPGVTLEHETLQPAFNSFRRRLSR